MGRYAYAAAASKAASMVYKSAWKRYNPWRKGGRWGNGKGTGKMRVSRKYTRTRAGEHKFHDHVIDDSVIATGGGIAAVINDIAQGTTESERIGRKCTIKSIQWRYDILYPQQSAVTGGDIVRIILYVDKQANGAVPAVLDIMETADYQSFFNLANQSRFRILMDRTYAVNATAGAGNGTANDTFSNFTQGQFYKRCNIPLEFSGTAGAITEIRSNNIGMFIISKVGLAGFTSQMRLRFTG